MAAVTELRKPSLVGAVHGDPFDRGTWSGSSHHLFSALSRRGVLAGVVSAEPPHAADVLAKLAAVHPRRRRWKERYEYSALTRRAMSATARRRVARIDAPYDATFQVGAWYDLGGRGARPALRSSYHDSNLALYAREHDWIEDSGARHVRRTFDAERRLYEKLDLIMPMSEWLRRSFIDDFGQDPEKVVTVGAGANLLALPDPPAERDFERPRILFVGKGYFEAKGGLDLIEAFRAVRAEHPNAELWIVGQPPPPDPPAGVKFFGLIRRSDPGGEAEIERIYREATLFALPSRYDAFGIAFLEAMAYELPCVGTDICAMPEIIAEGVTGRLVPKRDPDALAAALLDVLSDPARAAQMGAAGRRRVLEDYTWDRVAERVVAAVSARLEGSPSPAAVSTSS
jgi:glycosyltransferase involved in cell wall biosynthesis